MTDYKDIFESNPIGMWKIDFETGSFVDINTSALNLIGASNIEEVKNLFLLDKDLLASINQKEIKNYRIILNLKDGVETSALISAKFNKKDNTITGTIQECPSAITIECSVKPYIDKICNIKNRLIQKLNEPCILTGPR